MSLDKRLDELERRQRGPATYAVVDARGRDEDEVQIEIDAAYARHGKNLNVFVVRYDEPLRRDNDGPGNYQG